MTPQIELLNEKIRLLEELNRVRHDFDCLIPFDFENQNQYDKRNVELANEITILVKQITALTEQIKAEAEKGKFKNYLDKEDPIDFPTRPFSKSKTEPVKGCPNKETNADKCEWRSKTCFLCDYPNEKDEPESDGMFFIDESGLHDVEPKESANYMQIRDLTDEEWMKLPKKEIL